MSLLKNKLSFLQPGMFVRITQSNGQTIEGIVAENDGTESLSVNIMSVATIRYDQIGVINEVSVSGTEIVPIMPTKVSVGKSDIEKITLAVPKFDKNEYPIIFKAMMPDEKKALNSVHAKFQSAVKVSDYDKCKEVVKQITNIIKEKEWEYNPRVNSYFAQVNLFAGDLTTASRCLVYAGKYRDAFHLAYANAEKTKDDALYNLAASTAAVSLIQNPSEDVSDAVKVLQMSSDVLNDVSGMLFVIKKDVSSTVTVSVQNALRQIGKKFSPLESDTNKLIEAASKNCNAQSVVKCVERIIKHIMSQESKFDETALTGGIIIEPPLPPEDDPNKIHYGKITVYNMFEGIGTIETADNKSYTFEIYEVTDISLANQLKKSQKRKLSDPISVSFNVVKQGSRYSAIGLRRGSVPTVPTVSAHDKNTFAGGRELWNQQKYEEAIAVFEKFLYTDEWEEAVSQLISCYLYLWNKVDPEGQYSQKIEKLLEIHPLSTVEKAKTFEVLSQYFMKVKKYEECIEALNGVMETLSADDFKRTLHYLINKAICYNNIGDYPSAISQWLDWLEIVKRNRVTERYDYRDTTVYLELADLYILNGDFEEAEEYAKKAVSSPRRDEILAKIFSEINPQSDSDTDSDSQDEISEDESENLDSSEEPEEEEEEDPEDTVLSLDEAYLKYEDKDGIDALDITDEDVVSKVLSSTSDKLYCVLTYLKTAADMSENSLKIRQGSDGNEVYVGSSLKALDSAFAYAFNSPISDRNYTSSEIIAVFEETKNLIPDINSKLFAASAMYAFFETPAVPDYSSTELNLLVEPYIIEEYPMLPGIVGGMLDFRNRTGSGMDSYADYKTGGSILDDVINEAKACQEAISSKLEIYESRGQVRRTREYLFYGKDDKKSELRECLDAVAENDTLRYYEIKNIIKEKFIRDSKPITAEHIETSKIDKYIDFYWDTARDAILKEHRHVERPYDKIKSSKRGNIKSIMKRIIDCVCKWLAIVEHSVVNNEIYFQKQYDSIVVTLKPDLESLIDACDKNLESAGFNWGDFSIKTAAIDILSKLDGSYNERTRKYMFIDFLRGEEILLNDDYLPETRSTFSNLPDINILGRIERHAAAENYESFEQRINEILSESEEKHNFRSLRLIKEYGEDMGITEITEHNNIKMMKDCLPQARRRFEEKYADFRERIEMCISYGSLSATDGEREKIDQIATSWHNITAITEDYGFYSKLLSVILKKISENASQKGEKLRKRLQDIIDSKYDFGTAFSVEMINELIDDQNFSAAETIMNCIIGGDVRAVNDYTAEPYEYFSEFINEHATNYRTVQSGDGSLEDIITRYACKRDLQKAIIVLTNNARKETRGGANLIKSWIPNGRPHKLTQPDRIENLLKRLGFDVESITGKEGGSEEEYHVYCKKRIGKVAYVHGIPAFGSRSETDGFRVLCLYGRFKCDALMDKFRQVNTSAKNTLVFLNYSLNIEERRKLARKMKEEKSFSNTFIVVDRVTIFYLAKHYAENTVLKRMLAVTLPFSYYQPFVEQSSSNMPPELFTGRESELTSIESRDGANLVYGGRQLGKSALLKMAKRNIDKNGDNARAVYIDIQKLDTVQAAKRVSEELIIEGILSEDCRCDNWGDLAGHIKRRLMDENPETRISYLLLMLDEADEFIVTSCTSSDQPISALKTIPSDRFKLVMAGIHNLSRYKRGLLHGNSNLVHLNSIVVRQFRREEAIKLLTSTLAYLGFKFNDKIISNILASTNYYPGLIQFYCRKLLESMKDDDYAGYSQSNTPYYNVSESHFKKILADSSFTAKVKDKLEATLFAEEEGKSNSNYHAIALIIAYLYYAVGNDDGYTVEEILKTAQDNEMTRITSLKSEQLEELLTEMRELNVLIYMNGRYTFVTDGFRSILGSQDDIANAITKQYSGEVMNE